MAISNSSASNWPCDSLCRRTARRLGTRLCRSALSRLRLEWSTRSGADRGTGLERGGQAFVDQAEGDRLVEPGTGQEIADRRFDPLALPARGARERHGPVLGDVLVAVDPRDFLDQVDLALQVAPPARRAERQRGVDPRPAAPAPAPGGSATAVARSIVDPEDPLDLVEPERDRRAFRRPSADVDHAGMERPAGHLEDQLGAAAAGPLGRLGVERPLEPEARRAEQAQGPRGPADRHRVELGRLDQDVGRAGADLGLQARPSRRPGRPDARRRRSTSISGVSS